MRAPVGVVAEAKRRSPKEHMLVVTSRHALKHRGRISYQNTVPRLKLCSVLKAILVP